MDNQNSVHKPRRIDTVVDTAVNTLVIAGIAVTLSISAVILYDHYLKEKTTPATASRQVDNAALKTFAAGDSDIVTTNK